MRRRDFLKVGSTSAASYLLGAEAFAGMSDMAMSTERSSGSKVGASVLKPNSTQVSPFIVVFLRGGVDALGILSPLEDPNFLAARPPDMRFAMSAAAGSPIVLNGTPLYWLANALPITQLYANKRLVVWPAVGLLDETRSHFEAQEIMERGVQSLDRLPDSLGWIARAEQLSNPRWPKNSLPLFAGNSSFPRVMQGAHQVLVTRDLQGGIPFPGGDNSFKAMQALCNADSNPIVSGNMLETLQLIEEINRALPKQDNRIAPYASAGQSPYPNSDPGVGLRSVARLMQANVGLQYAWVDQGGWDTHEHQGWKLNYLVKDLAMALQAFDDDMQAQKKDYTLVVLSEFGRRLRSNKSNGTDHGHAGLALVMGSQVPGGQVMGKWPGLQSDALDRGVDLAVTTDYQDVLQQALRWRARSI
ncbi:DUF1501 domain-containing protein [Polynucleobacter paneuropaeus]|nr:DUF1501 domain-containing protein [Polynucleobacter paneuropaeus]